MLYKTFLSSIFFLGLFGSALQIEPARGEGQHPAGSFVTSQGTSLWVESEGRGEPLLLIAGGPGLSHDYFHPYFSRLAAGHRILYYDASGRGRSRGTPPCTFAGDVKDLEILRKSLGLRNWSLLGHSYGGMVALAYALEHPAEVRSLILIGTHWSGMDWQASNDALNARLKKENPDLWKNLQQLRARGLRSRSLSQVYRVPRNYYFYKAENAEAVGQKLSLRPSVYYTIAGEDADFRLGGDLADLDFRRQMKTLPMPVLVLGGRHDQVVPVAETLSVRSYLPKAKVVVFEQSGHYPFVEELEKTLLVVDRFLRGLSR